MKFILSKRKKNPKWPPFRDDVIKFSKCIREGNNFFNSGIWKNFFVLRFLHFTVQKLLLILHKVILKNR